MNGRRLLSESISEGDGISLLVHVTSPEEAVASEARGAGGLVAAAGVAEGLEASSALPVVVRGASANEAHAARAAAWLPTSGAQGDELAERYIAALELGLECIVTVVDDEELEQALATVDPEIILLSTHSADGGDEAVDRVLELLPDVPAGKLAVAELPDPTAGDVLALERAGVDAVVVEFAVLAMLADALQHGA